MTLAAVLLSAGLALTPLHARIAEQVAGEGRPACAIHRPDGTVQPCLPSFEVKAGVHVNAWSRGDRIIFTRAAMTRLSADEFALMAAHEVAHYMLRHSASTPEAELAADRLGAQLACRAGFDPAAGVSVLRHVGSGGTHPARAERQAAILGVPCRLTGKVFAR